MRRITGLLLAILVCVVGAQAGATVDHDDLYRDEITQHCVSNSAGTAYVIVKVNDYSIYWNGCNYAQVTQAHITGGGECNGNLLTYTVECYPIFIYTLH